MGWFSDHLDEQWCEPFAAQLFVHTQKVDLHHALGIASYADGCWHRCTNKQRRVQLMPKCPSSVMDNAHIEYWSNFKSDSVKTSKVLIPGKAADFTIDNVLITRLAVWLHFASVHSAVYFDPGSACL